MRNELNRYNSDWPYGCIIYSPAHDRRIWTEIWVWLNEHETVNYYAWDVIVEENGDVSFDRWFGFKTQASLTRFMLTWS